MSSPSSPLQLFAVLPRAWIACRLIWSAANTLLNKGPVTLCGLLRIAGGTLSRVHLATLTGARPGTELALLELGNPHHTIRTLPAGTTVCLVVAVVLGYVRITGGITLGCAGESWNLIAIPVPIRRGVVCTRLQAGRDVTADDRFRLLRSQLTGCWLERHE